MLWHLVHELTHILSFPKLFIWDSDKGYCDLGFVRVDVRLGYAFQGLIHVLLCTIFRWCWVSVRRPSRVDILMLEDVSEW